MAFPLTEPWKGRGLLWKQLIIQDLGGRIEGRLTMAQPAWMSDRAIDLSHHTCLNDAIRELEQFDFDYYSELILYADEG